MATENMKIDRALEIASALARGLDPDTGQPLNKQNALESLPRRKKREESLRTTLPKRSPSVEKYMYQVSEALVRHMADAHRGAEDLESLDDYLVRRRKECMPSLRMIGADTDTGWHLIRPLWTIQYWEERALKAELLLKRR